MELREVANNQVSRYLATCSIDSGREVILGALTAWGHFIASKATRHGWTFEDRYTFSKTSNAPELTQVNVNALVVYPHETQEQSIFRALGVEWCFRMTVFFAQTQTKRVRFQGIPEQLSSPMVQELAGRIFELLKKLHLDDGIDLLAWLAVEWSQVCSIKNLSLHTLGYQLQQSTDTDEWASRFILWSFAEYLQVEL